MNLPAYVKNCINVLESAGFSAFAVGGAVRDSLLGITPSDWDVTTSALPEDILTAFSDFRTIPTGIKHGTVTVLFEENGKSVPVEITTFRIDGEYKDSRHPESVTFSRNICEDLSRRDFTVNAMAYNETVGLVDVFGGRSDLDNRIIRAVGDPELRFGEDALRILRAFRFAAQLDFTIEEKTLAAASKKADLLSKIARERIAAETKKLLTPKGVSKSLRSMIENGIWYAIFPAVPSDNVVNRLGELPDGFFELRLSALLSDMSETETAEMLASLRLSNAENKKILRLIRARAFVLPQSADELPIFARRFLHLYSNVLDEALCLCSFFNKEADFAAFESIVRNEQSQARCLSISDLAINGSDLLPLCSGRYELVGKTLARLLALVVDDPSLNNRETLLTLADNFITQNKQQ